MQANVTVPMVRPMSDLIDAHGHFVPPELMTTVRTYGRQLGSVSVATLDDGVDALAMPGLDVLRPMPPALTSRDESLRWLDEQGIGHQIVGTWADLFGYQLPAREGAFWCRMVNELQLSSLAGEPRLIPMAILPLQDPVAAVAEVEWAHEAGYTTVTVGCAAADRELDSAELEVVWASLADRNMGVVMHPLYHAAEERVSDLGLPNTVGRPHDTDVAVSRLVLSGVLARHPDTKLLLVHGGGSIPLLWGRLQRNHAVTSGTYDPEDSRQCLWVDSVVYRTDSLEFLVASMGEDRVLLGSDYPFPIRDPEPIRALEKSSMDARVRRKISHDNAMAFFRL